MTAIFAYAAKDVAFVAGDTCRLSNGFIPLEACKLYPWGEYVLLAQAGEAEFLTDLICRLIGRMSYHAPSASGFIQTFQRVQSNYWQRAQKRHNGNAPAGTVLIASASVGGAPATIDAIDFETGMLTRIPSAVAAAGSLPAQFQNHAIKVLPSHTSPNGVQLDNWALDCIDDAVKASPATIGWPADLLVSRTTSAGRLIAKVRIAGPGVPTAPMFIG